MKFKIKFLICISNIAIITNVLLDNVALESYLVCIIISQDSYFLIRWKQSVLTYYSYTDTFA